MTQTPAWNLTPTFASFTWDMLERHELPAFTGWRVSDMDTDAEIIATDDFELVKTKLVEFNAASPCTECISVLIPIMPQTEDDWAAAKEALSFIGHHDDQEDLPMAYNCTYPTSLQRIAETLTEAIIGEIPDYDDPKDFRVDDFENHPYCPLRDALMELFS